MKGTQRLGFVGTGAITAAMVRGLKASGLSDWPIVLSPRNAEVAAALAGSLPGVTVATSNQAVIDNVDIVVLAVLPQTVEAVVHPLRFRPEQRIISLVAATGVETIRGWTGVASVTRAIPLPFVEQRRGVTPIFPPDETAARIFTALGHCIETMDIDSFDAYAAASALMSTYFGIAEAARDWLVAGGLPAADSELYLRDLFGSLGDVLRASPLSFAELRTGHATRGGLNELAHDRFVAGGGPAAIADGLSAVMVRLRSQRQPTK